MVSLIVLICVGVPKLFLWNSSRNHNPNSSHEGEFPFLQIGCAQFLPILQVDIFKSLVPVSVNTAHKPLESGMIRMKLASMAGNENSGLRGGCRRWTGARRTGQFVRPHDFYSIMIHYQAEDYIGNVGNITAVLLGTSYSSFRYSRDNVQCR